MRFLRSIVLVFILLSSIDSRAQQTQTYVSTDADYRNALDLYQKQKYIAALDAFDQFVLTQRDKNNLLVIDAEYYAALCALELFHKDAEWRLTQFIARHPESQKAPRVCFQLGRYNFRKKSYPDALLWFKKVDVYDLQKEEKAEFHFKRGYAHYQLHHIDSAKRDFYEIKDIDTKYTSMANYYYSHIAYLEGNYETALTGFQRLVSNETFGPIVPYYIAQIYYLQKRYDEVIRFAPPLMDSADSKRQPLIARIIGESYYKTGKYKEAVPYLKRYQKGVGALNREEAYELAYAYYRSDSIGKATEFFQEAVGDTADRMGQNIWYHLADCQIRQNKKLEARNAFGKASAMSFDPGIKEDALFNYARLSYELSYSPYNEAIIALQNYLEQYPNTARHDEAYALLTDVYLSSKNYAKALQAISGIKTLPPKLQSVYQQVAYNRAVELFQQKNYDDAVKHFDLSLTYPINRDLAAQARYWKGETWYTKGEFQRDSLSRMLCYTKAIGEYKSFQLAPAAALQNNFNRVNYNIGYCYFEQSDWISATVWLRKYVAIPAGEKPDLLMDADLRLGDAYFRMNDYLNAAEYYGKARQVNTGDNDLKDYALFQQAMALGYQGKKNEKADLLRQLRTTYPTSLYLANSRYQEARVLHDMRRYDEALPVYQKLYDMNPNSAEGKLCLINMALIYSAKNDPDNALLQFQKAAKSVKDDGTGQYITVMREIKEIYLSRNQLNQWETYAASMGFQETAEVADSTSFVVADKLYRDGNCKDALTQLNRYVERFPSGSQITRVYYMRAECSFKNNDMATALSSYNAVISRGKTPYYEPSLQQSAYLYYKQQDYQNAVQTYRLLEIQTNDPQVKKEIYVNAMRSYVLLSELDSATTYAAKVIEAGKYPDDIMLQAYYLQGRKLLSNQNDKEAEPLLQKVVKLAPLTDYAAEANYGLLLIKLRRNENKKVEKECLKFVSDYAAYKEWSGKGMLLLSDNYLAMNDRFQAKLVLQNYIENGDVPELIQQAKDKLAALELSDPSQQRIPPAEFEVPTGEQEGGEQ
jgi:tetratricopeptide (TPR) repeat protein